MSGSKIVTLAEIENHDDRPRSAGRDEFRYLCSLSAMCLEKTRDAAHRSLSVNKRTGAFYCHRCGTRGKLKEYWEERHTNNGKFQSKRAVARAKLSDKFAVAASEPPRETHDPEKIERLLEGLAVWQSDFLNSPAEMYLTGRGIPPAIAGRFRCGYAPRWEHWEKENEKWRLIGTDERVIFPITDKSGNLTAVQARAINKNFTGAEKLTKGDKSAGLFQSPDIFSGKILAITEGPVDALALAAAGIPAAAMMGTSYPAWLPLALGFKFVLLATDADASGDAAAAKLTDELKIRGARIFRLRPRRAKDWAEVLEKIGAENLGENLKPFAAEAGDELKTNSAWRWFTSGRPDAARFLTQMIEDGECREWLFEKYRQHEKPDDSTSG
jgi:DNA primase